MSEAPKVILEKAKAVDLDYADPIIQNDIGMSPERLASLKEKAPKCFLCLFILRDFEEHGTLRGYHVVSGSGERVEMFPLRGEINHLYLEFHNKPYPWNEPLKDVEAKPTKIEGGKIVPLAPPTARPVQSGAVAVQPPTPPPEEKPRPIATIKPLPPDLPPVDPSKGLLQVSKPKPPQIKL